VAKKKVIITGASGLVGSAALERFTNRDDWDVVATSRRPPVVPLANATHIPLDLSDKEAAARVFGAMPDATHVIFAALNENTDDLVGGWSDPKQMAKNAAMLTNLMDPLLSVAKSFKHISLVHGGKAYGVHLRHKVPCPIHEDVPRHEGDNFYHRQEDYIRAKQAGQPWHWSILRPCMIFGTAVGSNMNTFFVLVVLAALRKEAGLDMPMPSGVSMVHEPTDSAIIAEALEWAMAAPAARNEIFNLHNGDLFSLHDGVPIVAQCLGMKLGETRRYDLNKEIDVLAHTWPTIVDKYKLNVPRDVYELLGTSIQVANSWTDDMANADLFRWGFLSTMKIRLAGFHGCVDNRAMLARYVRRFQELRMIPPAA
jgi:nucleoside-diphosphate-sugar epimerase